MTEDCNTLSDEEILQLSIKKPSVFEVLVRRYQAPFLRKAHRILHHNEDAEDAVQEAFTKIYLNAGRFIPQEGATFSSWGYKILVNTCYTFYQKRKKTFEGRTQLDDEIFYNLSGKENERKEIELRDMAASLLAHLPKHMHRVLHLHFIMGYRQQEIAEMTGEKVGAVKTRIFRAKEELRKVYAAQNNE